MMTCDIHSFKSKKEKNFFIKYGLENVNALLNEVPIADNLSAPLLVALHL